MPRPQRIASNESFFRATTERLEEAVRHPFGFTPFLCECADVDCLATIELTLDEYERARADPALGEDLDPRG